MKVNHEVTIYVDGIYEDYLYLDQPPTVGQLIKIDYEDYPTTYKVNSVEFDDTLGAEYFVQCEIVI